MALQEYERIWKNNSASVQSTGGHSSFPFSCELLKVYLQHSMLFQDPGAAYWSSPRDEQQQSQPSYSLAEDYSFCGLCVQTPN